MDLKNKKKLKNLKDNMKKDHRHGHRARLREKFLNSEDALHNYELMEMLLAYSIKRKDTKATAKNLLKKFKSISGTLNAPKAELCKIQGISDNTAALIKLVKKLCEENLLANFAENDLLSSPDMAVDFIKTKFGYSCTESFMVIFLNTKNRIIKQKILFQGTVDQAAVYPREIIKSALELGSSGIIIAHNHPSGNCNPSDEDKKITKQIKNAAEIMNIRLLDHIIVGRNKYFSFAEEKIL